MKKRIFLWLTAILALLLVDAALKPNTLRVSRSVDIAAPPAKVFALLNDFHAWPQWAPQDKSDPAMVRTYSGSTSGVGAVTEWHGKGETGAGRMEITQAAPDKTLAMQAQWKKPFAADNTNTFTLEPTATGTRVTWAWEGQNVYMLKLMSIFVNPDKQMGSHFEAGLASLKAAAEK
jgi:uncharacterized protein YndB with AHSA1/START domain